MEAKGRRDGGQRTAVGGGGTRGFPQRLGTIAVEWENLGEWANLGVEGEFRDELVLAAVGRMKGVRCSSAGGRPVLQHWWRVAGVAAVVECRGFSRENWRLQ